MIKNILICGAGMMGKNIAFVFAGDPDYSVVLYDLYETDVPGGIRSNTKQLVEKEVMTEADVEERLGRISFTTDLDSDGIRNADFVIEAVFEEDPEAYNRFALVERDNGDGTTTVSLRVSGTVKLAGVIGRLSCEATSVVPETILTAAGGEADAMTRVYVTSDGEIRFIWTAAENATEEFTVFTLTYKAGVEAPDFTLEIEEARTIDERGEIVSAAYTLD